MHSTHTIHPSPQNSRTQIRHPHHQTSKPTFHIDTSARQHARTHVFALEHLHYPNTRTPEHLNTISNLSTSTRPHLRTAFHVDTSARRHINPLAFYDYSTTFANLFRIAAGVVKLVDIPDLGSGAARHGGSSPSTRTFPGNVLNTFCVLSKSRR